MRVGTKSVLWGVHAFWFHPIVVWLAWRRVYGRWPNWWQTVGIICHDSFGYWGKPNMDGPEGVTHVYAGAEIAGKIVDIFSTQRGWEVRYLCLYHSSTFAKLAKHAPSALYLPDKISILVEPKNLYLLRARLSGELREYVLRESVKQNISMTETQWYDRYRAGVQQKFDAFQKK